jgi:hypothetical protein
MIVMMKGAFIKERRTGKMWRGGRTGKMWRGGRTKGGKKLIVGFNNCRLYNYIH